MRLTLLAICVSGAAILMVSLAPAAAPGRVNVTATLTSSVMRELPPAGRQSNASELAWRLTDRNGRAVGRMLQVCRWVLPRQRFCAGEIRMPEGTLTFAGSSGTRFSGEYAVTGGTGRYDAGGGLMKFTAIGQDKTILLVTFR